LRQQLSSQDDHSRIKQLAIRAAQQYSLGDSATGCGNLRFNFFNLLVAVIPAIVAHVVSHFRLTAMRTGGHIRLAEFNVSAPRAPSLL